MAASDASLGRTTTSPRRRGDDLVEDVVLGHAVGTAGDHPGALRREQLGQPVAGHDRDDARAARARGRRGGPGPAGVTEMRCGRPASMPASIAAPMSATWTWTFHSRPVGVSTPTTTRLSPSAARRSCSRATAASSVSASRYCTSLPGPGGGWCGRSPACWWRWSRPAGAAGQRRARRLDAGDGGDERVEDEAEPRTAGVDDAGLAERGELARGGLQGGARAVGRRTDDVGEIGVARRRPRRRPPLRRSAGDGEEGALLRVGDGGVGGVGGLLQRGGERRPVGGRLAGELVGEAAQQLGQDGAGVAACAEDGAAGEDRPGRTRRSRRRPWPGRAPSTAACAVSRRLVPVSPSGTGKTLRSSSRAPGRGQGVDRGSVPLTDRGVVQRLQHGRRVPGGV